MLRLPCGSPLSPVPTSCISSALACYAATEVAVFSVGRQMKLVLVGAQGGEAQISGLGMGTVEFLTGYERENTGNRGA